MAARRVGSPRSSAEKQHSKHLLVSMTDGLQWTTRKDIRHTAVIEPGLIVVLSQVSYIYGDGKESHGAWHGTVTRGDSGAVLMQAADDSYDVTRAAILEYVDALSSVSVERDTPPR